MHITILQRVQQFLHAKMINLEKNLAATNWPASSHEARKMSPPI